MTPSPRHSWRSVRDEIHGWILSARYKPGDKLPRDEDIAAELGCARSTVVRAMQELTETGLVERKRRGGSQVSQSRPTRAMIEIPVHKVEIESLGKSYSTRLLSREETPAPPTVQARFRAQTALSCLHMRAIHFADGAPFVHEDRWVSLETAPDIAKVDLTEISANEWLVTNLPYDEVDVAFSAISADTALAAALECELQTPLFRLERVTWSQGAPITAVQSTFHPGYILRPQ